MKSHSLIVRISCTAAASAILAFVPVCRAAQTVPSGSMGVVVVDESPALSHATERGMALLRNARWNYPAAFRLYGAAGNRVLVVKAAAGTNARAGDVPTRQALVALDAVTGKQVGEEMPFLGGNPVQPVASRFGPQERLLTIGESNDGVDLIEETGAPRTSNVKIMLVSGKDKSTRWEMETKDYQALPVFAQDRVLMGATVFPLQAGGNFAGGVPDPPVVPMAVRAVDRATGKPLWSWPLPEGTRATSQLLPDDGKVFFSIDQTYRGRQQGPDRSGRFSLAALDAATGKEVWSPVPMMVDIPGPWRPKVAISAPALGGGQLVVSTIAGELMAYDARTGKQNWHAVISPDMDPGKSHLTSQISDGFDTNFPAVPVISNDMVCVSVGGNTEPPLGPEVRLQSGGPATMYIGGLAGFDVHTGKQKWFFRAPPVPSLAPLPNVSPQSLDMQFINVQSSGSHLIALAISWRSSLQSRTAGCLSLDAQTGQLEWFVPLNFATNAIAARPDVMAPVVSGGMLYLSLPNAMAGLEQGLYAMDLDHAPATGK